MTGTGVGCVEGIQKYVDFDLTKKRTLAEILTHLYGSRSDWLFIQHTGLPPLFSLAVD